MSHAAFVHLRVRSSYSLLDSTVRLPELVARVARERMPAVAIADRANLFAALEFSESAAKAGVQPIVGCLLPIAGDEQTRGNGRPPLPSWLPVLVQNQAGYRNLMKLLSRAYLDGEAGAAPELQLDLLAAYSDGLIALTGGPEGPVGRALASGNRGRAEGLLDRLRELFPGRLYIELMRHGLEVEDQIEPALIDLAIDARLAAGRDQRCAVHRRGGVGGARRPVVHRRRRPGRPGPKAACHAGAPAEERRRDGRAVRRSARGARQHPGDRPALRVPGAKPGADSAGVSDQRRARARSSELRARAQAGLELRLRAQSDRPGMTPAEQLEAARPYRERLDYELGVIAGMNYAGYFLIVADFIQWAKSQGVPVGPGRGSGAGSVVAWALSITDLDPLRASACCSSAFSTPSACRCRISTSTSVRTDGTR